MSLTQAPLPGFPGAPITRPPALKPVTTQPTRAPNGTFTPVERPTQAPCLVSPLHPLRDLLLLNP